MSRRLVVSIAVGTCTALLLVAWLALAPADLGGSVQYVTTTGDSMEPAFQEGDLALLRTSQSYETGDVIAYQHPEFGIILHRIIDISDEQFVVKGDNNEAADAYMPDSDDIVGEVWARIPGVGAAVTGSAAQWLRIGAAVTIGLFALIPLGIAFPTSSRRRSWQAPDVGAILRPNRFLGLLGQSGQLLVALLTFTAIAGLALAFVAYNRPVDRNVVVPIEYEQLASLSYSGSADGSVYSQGVVTTGDPVYRTLVDELTIQLDHEVFSDRNVAGDGDYWIDVIVEASDGWQRSVSLQDQTPFTGTSFDASVNLPLDRVDEAIEEFHSQTGLESIDDLAFAVRIVASVAFDGTITDEVIHTLTTDEILLLWQPDALYPEIDAASDESSNRGTIEAVRSIPNSINLGFLEMDVRTARMVAQIMLFTAIAGGFLVWILMRRALQSPEPQQIAARYRSRIVPIQGARQPTPSRIVALLSFDDLIRIADQKQEPILYFRRDQSHYYYVHAADVIYRVKIESDEEDQDLRLSTDI